MKIIYTQDNGKLAIIIPVVGVEEALKDVPEGKSFKIIDDNEMPFDRIFRNSWEHDFQSLSTQVTINLNKAKEISHSIRRIKRDQLLEPLDRKVTIPGEAAQAEIERKAIRDNDALVQVKIDDCVNDVELLQVLKSEDLY